MIDQIEREWFAWRQVCKQLAVLGIGINDKVALAAAIRLWGEELHTLRLENPEHDQKALRQHRKEYEPYVLDDWTS